jgi:MSHA biogenesis protein MshI
MGQRMLSFFSRRRKPGWLAIVPQAGGITLAHVVRDAAERPEVRLLDCFALEQDLGDALLRLRSSWQFKSYACTTLMASGEYTITQLDAPNVPAAERKEALRWALKESVSYPVDKACIDVLDIPAAGLAAGRPVAVLVFSASEPAVRAHVAPFESAKILLEAVDVPELAQRNVAALLEDENRGLAFLRVDESGMMLTLTYCGELVAVRRGEISAAQLNGPDEEQRIRVRERLVLELQRSLDNFDRQYSHIPISKVVLATYPTVARLAADLGQSTYVPVKDMDLSPVLDFPAIPELRNTQSQAKNLLAIGAALRTTEAAR